MEGYQIRSFFLGHFIHLTATWALVRQEMILIYSTRNTTYHLKSQTGPGSEEKNMD